MKVSAILIPDLAEVSKNGIPNSSASSSPFGLSCDRFGLSCDRFGLSCDRFKLSRDRFGSSL